MEVNAAKMGGGLGWSKGNKKWKGIYDVVFMSLRELNTGRGEEREEELRAFLFFFFPFFFPFFDSLSPCLFSAVPFLPGRNILGRMRLVY